MGASRIVALADSCLNGRSRPVATCHPVGFPVVLAVGLRVNFYWYAGCKDVT